MSTMFEPTLPTTPRPLASSNATVWKRLLWKEFRELLPIWVTILFGAAFCILLINVSPLSGGRYESSLELSTLICCQGFAVLVCLTNGVLPFALERENRTHQLLYGLPVQPKRVVWIKLTVGLVGSLAMIVLLAWGASFVTYLASGSMSKTGLLVAGDEGRQAVLLAGPIVFLLVGVVAAIIASSTVYAFVIAAMPILAAAFGTQYIGLDRHVYDRQGLIVAAGLSAAIACLIGIVAWQSQRWIEGRDWKLPNWFRFLESSDAVDQLLVETRTDRSPNPFPVLLWQSFKVAWGKLGLLVASIVLFLVGTEASSWNERINTASIAACLTAIGLSLTLLLSATVFLSDQQNGTFRFFQQHVERSRWFWLTRLIPWWLTVLMIAGGLATIADYLIASVALRELNRADFHEFVQLDVFVYRRAILTVGFLAALAIGQFWSMIVRNFAIAMIFSLISGAVVFTCIGWLIFMGESLTWFIMPLVVTLYWATWYRAKYWLADSAWWRSHVVAFSCIAAVIAMTWTGFVRHRANELPDTKVQPANIATLLQPYPDQNFRVDQLAFGTPEQRQSTAELYRQALASMSQVKMFDGRNTTSRIRGTWDQSERGPDELRADNFFYSDFRADLKHALDECQSAVELLLQAADRVGCDPFLDPNSSDKRWVEMNQLRSLMMAHCLVMLEQNDHGRTLKSILAFDRVVQRTQLWNGSDHWAGEDSDRLFYDLLIRWSERPGQSAGMIRKAIERLEYGFTDGNKRPTTFEITQWGASIKAAKAHQERQWANAHWHSYRERGGEGDWFELIHRLWEIDEQGVDPHNIGLPYWLASLPSEQQRASRFIKRQVIAQFSNTFFSFSRNNDQVFADPSRQDRSLRERMIPQGDELVFGNGIGTFANSDYEYAFGHRETLRRYTLLRLALSAYHCENGEYPERLSALKPYFQYNLPKTLYQRRDFAWFPSGLPEVAFNEHSHSEIILEPNRAMLLPVAIREPIDTTKRKSFRRPDPDSEEEFGIPIPIILDGVRFGQFSLDPHLDR